jgi:transposase-like protein
MQYVKSQLARQVAQECKSVEDVHNALKDLFKRTFQETLETEMSEHLGYEKNDVKGNNSGNSRNGYSSKKHQNKFGETELDIQRDRNGKFEPQIIKKYEKSASEIEEQIIAMYAKGMSTRDVEAHMKDIYNIDVSADF